MPLLFTGVPLRPTARKCPYAPRSRKAALFESADIRACSKQNGPDVEFWRQLPVLRNALWVRRFRAMFKTSFHRRLLPPRRLSAKRRHSLFFASIHHSGVKAFSLTVFLVSKSHRISVSPAVSFNCIINSRQAPHGIPAFPSGITATIFTI